MRLLQFVWWGGEREYWSFGLRRWNDTWRYIYRWSMCLGPVELRRWETRSFDEMKKLIVGY